MNITKTRFSHVTAKKCIKLNIYVLAKVHKKGLCPKLSTNDWK